MFPDDFVWGAATAAYQVEGAATEGGRGPSIWDTFTHTPGRTYNADTGDIATDHFHRFHEDFDLMSRFGLNGYRFSIAWPRVVPDRDRKVNNAGLDHYERYVDALLERGIEPIATLFHWDLPQWAQDKGGWLNRDTAQHFADYSHTVLCRLGDRIPKWITLNEPWTVAIQGYARGLHAPGMRDYSAAGTVIHHLLLGHGLAVDQFRGAGLPGAQIGVTLSMAVTTPWSDSPEDVRASEVLDGEQNRVFLDPLFHGTYPTDMFDIFPSLENTKVVQNGDLATIGRPIDYLGVNYYVSNIVKADPLVPLLGARPLIPQGPRTSAGLAAAPAGLLTCLTRLRREYTSLPIYVTEVGASFHDYVDPNGEVHDPERILYLEGCLDAISHALEDGVDVRGLYVWSLLDNLEWERGYAIRFGLIYVEYGTQRRTPKASAYWYRDIIRSAHTPARGPETSAPSDGMGK